MARPEYPSTPIEGYPNGRPLIDPGTKLQPSLSLKITVKGLDGTERQVPLFIPDVPPLPAPPAFPPS